jgi:hypothetical protein
MEKKWISYAHQAFFFAEKTITQTKVELDKFYGDSAQLISMLKKWFTEFCCGCTSTRDVERSEHPVEIAAPETIEKITI